MAFTFNKEQAKKCSPLGGMVADRVDALDDATVNRLRKLNKLEPLLNIPSGEELTIDPRTGAVKVSGGGGGGGGVTAYAWSKGSGKYAFLDKDIAPESTSDTTKMIEMTDELLAISQLDLSTIKRVSEAEFKLVNVTSHTGVVNKLCYSETLGLFAGVSGRDIFTSSDGIAWNVVYTAQDFFSNICYSETLGLFVAVTTDSYKAFYTSSDGTTWTNRTTSSTGIGALSGICYSETLGLFVAVGANPGYTNSPAVISSDGITWTTKIAVIDARMADVCYSETLGLFVAVGATSDTNKNIGISSDGINWTTLNSGVTNNLSGVCYSETLGLFVAVGASGIILTSTDGTTWSSQTSGTSNLLKSVCYSETLGFVAVGDSGTILTSSDGINWTTLNSGVTNNLSGVCYSETLDFVIVGTRYIIINEVTYNRDATKDVVIWGE